MNYIKKLRLLLDRKTKKHLVWLVVFSVVVAIIETLGISAIMPFIDIATNFKVIQTNQYYKWIFNFFGFEDGVAFAIFFGLVLIGFYIVRGGMNWLYAYVMAHFAENIYAQTTKKLFETYLAMPYQVFAKKNSSYLTKSIISEAVSLSTVTQSALLMISESFVIVLLYILMLLASWETTFIFTLILIIKIFLLTQTISKKLKIIGRVRTNIHEKFYEILNRVFNNFKQIKFQNTNELKNIKTNFNLIIKNYTKINIKYIFFSVFAKLFLEISGFILIILSLIILIYSKNSNISYILPTLSLFILILYRLLPSINRIVNGYNQIIYNHKAIDIINEELNIENEHLENQKALFTQKIKLENICFCYQEKLVINNLDLTINKGEKIALIGKSGSGKSTLLDLIIGLLRPNQGKISVDNIIIDESNLQNWRSQIGYISQQVYLFDGTVAENVCFGREINKVLLEKVLKQANIFDFLQSEKGVNTLVGEGGIQLSGGQKQRVAIARALYGQPNILVLDEATSALDDNIEKKIMNEIYQISKNKTLIIVAHRLSTIQDCDKIYRIIDGKINQTL